MQSSCKRDRSKIIKQRDTRKLYVATTHVTATRTIHTQHTGYRNTYRPHRMQEEPIAPARRAKTACHVIYLVVRSDYSRHHIARHLHTHHKLIAQLVTRYPYRDGVVKHHPRPEVFKISHLQLKRSQNKITRPLPVYHLPRGICDLHVQVLFVYGPTAKLIKHNTPCHRVAWLVGMIRVHMCLTALTTKKNSRTTPASEPCYPS